jgi:hypothetical protein
MLFDEFALSPTILSALQADFRAFRCTNKVQLPLRPLFCSVLTRWEPLALQQVRIVVGVDGPDTIS